MSKNISDQLAEVTSTVVHATAVVRIAQHFIEDVDTSGNNQELAYNFRRTADEMGTILYRVAENLDYISDLTSHLEMETAKSGQNSEGQNND